MMKYTIKAISMISKEMKNCSPSEVIAKRIELVHTFTPSDRDKLEDLIIHLFIQKHGS